MDHRRAHSEIFLRFPDDISFGGSMKGGDNNEDDDDLLATYMDVEKIEFFGENQNDPVNNHSNDYDNKNRKNIKQCFNMDEYSGFSSNYNDNDNDNDKDGIKINKIASCETKKAMPPDKLAELWVADPKRAKRILANRQSAARSKERKARYMEELEKRAKSLQTKATALSVQLSLFKRDTNGLTNENIDLRQQLESMQQHAQLRDALNDALKQELDRLKAATGDTTTPADSFVMPLQNNSHHSQQQQQQQQQLSRLQPYEINISHCSIEHNSHQTDMLHNNTHQIVNQPIEVNMFNLPQQLKVQQFCPVDRGLFLPFESSKLRMTPQFCSNEANMNCPPQQTDSPLGHLPPYAFESNSQSPEQEVYTTSQPHLISQMPKQDHITKFHGLDINSIDSFHLVKVEGQSIIANENMDGF